MRKFVTTFGAAVLVLGLAGCGNGPVPTPQVEDTAQTPIPVVTEDRLAEILQSVQETVTAADAASSADQLGARLTGPAFYMRQGEYALAAATGGANPVTPIVADSQLDIVSTTTEWPRIVNVVTQPPEGTNLPVLLTLVQQDARSNYMLWSWVRLFPGVTVPATAPAVQGSPVVAPDSAALVMSPDATLATYADAVNGGANTANFMDDAFRTNYSSTLSSLSSAIGAVGSVSQISSVNPSGSYSVATADGGAIVVGAIDQVVSIQRTQAGATLNVGPNLAYGGDPAVAGVLWATYMTTVAFYVPPADAENRQVQVLGAEQVLVSVTRDDSVSPG